MKEKEALGIDDFDFIYYELSPKQQPIEEVIKTSEFIENGFANYLKENYPNYYSKNIKTIKVTILSILTMEGTCSETIHKKLATAP